MIFRPAGFLCAVLAAFVALPDSLLAQPEGYRIAPEPDWADPLPVEPPESIPKDDLDDGVFYFLTDETERVATGERFGQYARKIVSQAGVQNGSEIHVDFDPAYQKIDLHRVDVQRDGQWQERLEPSLVSLLQREQDMERFLLDGSYTLVIRLPDIRPGDIVRYSFTLRGSNPVMGGRFYRAFNVGYGVPAGLIRQRLLTEPGQNLQIRSHGTRQQPDVRDGRHEWLVENPPPAIFEDSVPEWVTVFPWVEASAWGDWSNVVEWAMPLYPRGQPLGEEMEGLLDEWRKIPDTLGQAEAALRFAQEEIRYLAVASGIHSHQPRPPEEVSSKRFGDCKEKVLLLMHLLDRLGIENHPVFVNSGWGRGVKSMLPSPFAFDHVILEVVFGGESFFVDPTRTGQRGSLGRLYLPDYGWGLRIRDGEQDLVPVGPRAEAEGSTHVRENLVMGDVRNKQPSTLQVVTTHEGASAESARRQFEESGLAHIQNQSLNFYAQNFPSIELMRSFEVVDDADSNRFVVTETYLIPKLWQPSGKDPKVMEANIYHQQLTGCLSWPNRNKRRWPFRLPTPSRFSIETHVHLPGEWPNQSETVRRGDPWFDFEYQTEVRGATARLEGRYHAKVELVDPADVAAYRTEAQRAYEDVGFQFTYNTAVDPAFANPLEGLRVPNFFLFGVMAVTLTVSCAGGAALMHRRRRRPPLPPHTGLGHLDGLGGWLILIGLGLVLAPLRLLATIIQTTLPYLHLDAWLSLTTPQHPAFQPLLASTVTLAAVINTGLFVMLLVAIFLFFRKRREFPGFYIALCLISLAVAAGDLALAGLLPGTPESMSQNFVPLVHAAIGAAIWIPYMLISKRVKATFRR